MKKNIPIRLKAAFLLTVFALNTIVGFACSVGVDIGFNTLHHHDDEAKDVSVHVHADGKKHDHEEESGDVLENHNENTAAPHHHDEEAKEVSVHVHSDGKKHQHKEDDNDISVNIDLDAKEHHHHYNKKDASKEDDCCNDKVVKIIQTDKAVVHSTVLLHPVFFTAFISAYYDIDVTYTSQVNTSVKYFVRGHHPPIPDIRIAIQSFQI